MNHVFHSASTTYFLRKASSVIILLVFFLLSPFAATTTTTPEVNPEDYKNSIVAMANPNYLVTPGDVYNLAYFAGSTAVSQSLIVDSSYKFKVSNLAVLDVRGKTFNELKTMVEQVISRNFPLSGVQFVLTTPAVFTVLVKGEVTLTSEPRVNSLTRLSTVVKPLVTSYSSIRDIQVSSATGTTKTYDLFKAERLGDLSHDPYLRPGDIIILKRAERVVKVEGAVERAGAYQLLPGEELASLLGLYASGLIPLADTSRIELIRYIDSASASGNKIMLSQDNINQDYSLQHLDTITIPQVADLSPVMFIEGAVSVAVGAKQSPNTEVSSRLVVRFTEDENYASLVRRYRNEFNSSSDTANAYIIRGEKHLPINLNPILYDASFYSEYTVQKDDILLVPFRQFFVTVAGAVKAPGRYPYLPDRDWAYYVALAGGFDTISNAYDSVIIKNIFGKKQNKKDPIFPETFIEAKQNSFLFYFNLYSPVIVTTLTIISSTFAVKALLQSQ